MKIKTATSKKTETPPTLLPQRNTKLLDKKQGYDLIAAPPPITGNLPPDTKKIKLTKKEQAHKATTFPTIKQEVTTKKNLVPSETQSHIDSPVKQNMDHAIHTILSAINDDMIKKTISNKQKSQPDVVNISKKPISSTPLNTNTKKTTPNTADMPPNHNKTQKTPTGS